MNEFVTLSRSQPEFQTYLLGEFSSEMRALPVRSFNINSQNEKVTFHLVHLDKISRPTQIHILARVFRFDLLTLTMMPALVVAVYLWPHVERLDLLPLALFSLFFLHGAVFCRNDFVDHMRGVDRLNEKAGSQVIQKGWLKAVTVKKLYVVFLAVALSLALPVFATKPELSLLAVVVAFLGVLGHSHLRWGFGHWLMGDLAAFLCLGPLLVLGMSWALVGAISPEVLGLGVYFGLLAFLYIQARHVMSMVIDDEAGLVTMPVRWGFDRAKWVMSALLATLALALFGFSWLSWLGSFWIVTIKTALILWLAIRAIMLAKKIKSISSPLSSALYSLPQETVRLHFYSGLIFILIIFMGL